MHMDRQKNQGQKLGELQGSGLWKMRRNKAKKERMGEVAGEPRGSASWHRDRRKGRTRGSFRWVDGGHMKFLFCLLLIYSEIGRRGI